MAAEKSGEAGQVAGTPQTAIEVRLRSGQLELRFTRRFTSAELAAVKAIRGRSWDAQRRVWLLPHTPEVLDDLRRSFGLKSAQAHAPLNRDDSNVKPQEIEPAVEASADGFQAILDAMRRTIRMREYSRKTELSYLGWARRFLMFHSGAVDSPERLGASHASAFLEHLALNEQLAPKSRNQAAAALSFMFREIMGRDEMSQIERARGPRHQPMVLSHREVLRVLEQLRGKFFLIVVLLYSAGLRLEECLRLRVKDVDFELRQILIRNGKGQKDRYVPLARRAAELLRAQIARTAELHRNDLTMGHGWAPLPAALHRKDPQAGHALGWQFIFPASTMNRDPASGRTGRWSLHASAVQRKVKAAVHQSGLTKRASCHTFRHSFAIEALRGGCDIRTLQHVMGHKDIRTTMIYLHVVEQTGVYIQSPIDRPDDPDDSGVDTVGTPWAATGLQWELAARQWLPARGRRNRRT
jgi:integron integrase